MTKSSFLVQLLLWFLTLASYLGETSAKIGPLWDLVIANVDVSPDGYTRMAAPSMASSSWGDDFVINVINNLNDSSIVQSTSIHWHGLFQRGTSTVVVIGCPISHNNSFLYKFNAGNQAGTFGITHTYVGLTTQYYEGLRGPMIIYDSLDPHAGFYDVDDGI
ncbi:uncharacterized protein ARMOST_22340 [Armillaria ostoyae]|uniref:Plastocyanin-like domain-containing protein n=1 Tax=Armillaria ostoyae TaxID=47428 RepID=A0A284SCL8_ARMOS|nr:uncharacterized protein ARMOST_22340 [Armillaria ostoyae]